MRRKHEAEVAARKGEAMDTSCNIRGAVRLVTFVVCAWAVQPQAQSSPITITNPSFEQPPLSQDSGLGGNNPSFFALTGWHATNVVVPADTGIWHYSPSPSGVYDDPIPDRSEERRVGK